RAQVPRDAALPGRAYLDEPDPVLSRRACARHAALLLRGAAGRRAQWLSAARPGAGASPPLALSSKSFGGAPSSPSVAIQLSSRTRPRRMSHESWPMARVAAGIGRSVE